MKEKRIVYPANKKLIDPEVMIDDLPSVKLYGKRLSDLQEGWFYFSPILGSYHTITPPWVKVGDEIEFFEPLDEGGLRSLLLPGIKVASGSVSRLFLEDGNILLFSNLAGVHQSFHLLQPRDLDNVHEIIIDLAYLEESCPQCGCANVFHYQHSEKRKSFSKCLNCGYDWKGKIKSELILVKKSLEEKLASELERHPHLAEMLARPAEAADSSGAEEEHTAHPY
jgi:predicted RNA-binding Zn-ribbon protein involved in translation (DUF1610 family)